MEKSSFIRTVVVLTCWAWSVSGSLLHGEQVLRLVLVEDTYCVNNSSIHGMEPTMQVSHNQYGEWQRVAYLKFDISTVPTEVDSVVLRLYTDGWQAGGSLEHRFRFYPVQRNDWAEDDISYTNASAKLGDRMDSPLLAESAPVGQGAALSAGWIEWRGEALRQYVTDSARAAREYVSLRLREANIVKSSSGSSVVVHFHSKEHTSGNMPELIVYSPDNALPADRDPVIEVHDSTEARLAKICVDGEPLENFDKDVYAYVVPLPYSTTEWPEVTASAMDTSATVAIDGTTVTTTSADGLHHQTYELHYEILPKMDLFLAIGQSNMSGRAPYADVAEPLEGVYLLTPNGSMEVAQNPLNKNSNIRKDLSVQGQGPHYQFARSLRDSLAGRTVGMVVNCQGGSSILSWYTSGKPNYDKTLERAKKALRWGEYKGIIWHQGESDVTNGLSDNYATYRTQLSRMIAGFRAELGCDTIWFIPGELRQRDATTTFNEVVIHDVSTYIPYSDYVVSSGTSTLSDNTHFDEASVQLMGQRYADKILEHVYVQRTKDPSTKYEGTMYDVQRDKVLSVEDGIVYIVVEGKKMNLLGQPKY